VTGRTFNNVGFGSALLARRNVDWIDGGDHRIEFGLDDVHDRVVVQWVVYQKQNIRYLVAHFHGVWLKGNTKGDSAVRLEQSRQVRTLLAQLQLQYQVDKVIFGGDFNLDIKTESLRILCEGEGADDTVYRNLIVEQNIVSTRTSLYREHGQSGACLYADYVLVSKGVKVERFEVRTHTLISDHASLIVTFS
jgi:endonuclease/exonuclease/phosphatase family metal-dependent hydrolase